MGASNSEYISRENRKRNIRSFGIALLVYILLFVGYWGWSLLFRQDLDMNQGPVLIRLGEPEGLDTPPPIVPEEKEAPPEKEAEPEKVEKSEPVETPDAEPILPELNEKDSSDEVVPAEETPAVKEAPPAPPEPLKGSEAGNNYELTSEGGEIGRSLWVPIYLYMPLPREIDSVISNGDLVNILDNVISDETGLNSAEYNRKILLKYYDKKSKKLALKEQVSLDSRPELWTILERAGYNLNEAEYKDGRIISPVTVHFSVVPSGDSNVNELVDLELVKSSDIDEIDEAVLYAFEQSSYYIKSEEPIKGRFTYRFY